jgi:hypothetical protein
MARVTFVHGIGNKPEPRALLDLWRRKLAPGAGAIDLGDAGVESSMVYWADVLCERPDPDLSAFESGAGVGVAKSPEGHRWDSPPKARFAPDSPLEGSGFEPSVPPQKERPLRARHKGFRDSTSRGVFSPNDKIAAPVTGTEGSNPSSSSGASVSRYEVASFSPEVPNFPNGCHVCEVEIDPETGTTRVLRYVVVDDVGTVINPLSLAGQIHGGVVQGIGQAFTEHLVYDERSGQLLTGSFMDYGLPRADEVCSRHAIFCARRTRAFCISERRAKKPSEQNGCSGGVSKLILNDICKK